MKDQETLEEWFNDHKVQCQVCGNDFWSRHTKLCERRNRTRVCYYCCRKCRYAEHDRHCAAIICTWDQK